MTTQLPYSVIIAMASIAYFTPYLLSFISKKLFKKKPNVAKTPVEQTAEVFVNPEFDKPFSIITDTASFAIFDNSVLAHRVHDEVDWLVEDDYHHLPEVKRGDIALVSVVIDGCYTVIVTKQELDDTLKGQITAKVTLGVKVTSGICFVGNAESLPSAGSETTPDDLKIFPHMGGFFELDNGLYDVDICLFMSENEEDDDNENFVDFRFVFRPRTQDFVAPTEEPRLLF